MSGAKGDSTVQGTEKSQASFNQSLQAAFSTQFAKQSALLNFFNNKLQFMASNPTGFTPATMEAMNSQAINNTAEQEQNAIRAAGERSAAQGGNGLPSGVQAQVNAQIAAGGQQQLADELNQNQIANGQLQQQNQWRAIDALSGGIAAENPNQYASEANQAAGTEASLSEANTQAEANSFGGQFMKSLAGGLAGTASDAGNSEAMSFAG